MRSDGWKYRRLLVALIAMVTVPSAGCGSHAAREEAEARDQAVRDIDQRDYAAVIDHLEENRDEDAPPLTPALEWLLAQAHLGAAGIEPMRLRSRLTGRQEWRDPELEKLYAHCGTEAIARADAIPGKCLVKRLVNALPDAGNPHLRRAIELFAHVHPDAASAPRGHNLLIAIAYLSRAFARAGATLELYRKLSASAEPDAGQLDRMFGEIGLVAVDAREALKRARSGPRKVSELLAGNAALLVGAGTSVELVEGTVLPQLIELGQAREETPDVAMTKLGVIQKMDELLAEP